MRAQNFETVIWREGKYYVAQCLNVDVSSFGKTKKTALKNLQEALELYFEDAKPSQITKVDNAEVAKLAVAYA